VPRTSQGRSAAKACIACRNSSGFGVVANFFEQATDAILRLRRGANGQFPLRALYGRSHLVDTSRQLVDLVIERAVVHRYAATILRRPPSFFSGFKSATMRSQCACSSRMCSVASSVAPVRAAISAASSIFERA